MNTYVAVDVETANPNLASICQIGLAKFNDGQCIDERVYYVDPKERFDHSNIFIHRIDESIVAGAPTFKELYKELLEFFADHAICSHTGFDRASFWQACAKYKLPPIENVWIDSAKVARRTWSFCQHKGYRLKNLCDHFKIELNHHDALSDAKAAGWLLHKAMTDTGLSLPRLSIMQERSFKQCKRMTLDVEGSTSPSKKEYDINEDGHLFGENIVFTGSLSITRDHAASLAAESGCKIHNTVKKSTTLIVVGVQNMELMAAGCEKSVKHRKAEELIGKGQSIRIITESDFLNMLELDNQQQPEPI